MTSYRLIIKIVFAEIKNSTHRKLNVIIYGTGRAGLATKTTLEHDSAIRYKVIAFLDNQDHNVGKKLEGVHIYSYDKLTDLIDNFSVSMLFFSRKERNQEIRNEITEICLKNDIKVLAVPPANNWIDGELTIPQIKRVKIEDLLERPPIILDPSRINKEVYNKVVLVTGAAGSIGSEIVRQLTQFRASKLILFDQAESPLHLIDLELFERIRYKTYEIEIGDITNKSRLENLFLTYKPDIVFHAAAYKHVPLMEYHPAEAVRTNVSGTKILADLSVKYQVKKFIMISTDKAVNPTSVMGASKRLAEIYIQSLNDFCFTSFITTRFGNVLGSNGSVIPRFRKQIESGGPVTITHPDITRYFMTIPEACQLVLEACAMGQGGEIFIFDMGKSIKIVDLAKKMIRLTGLKLGRDIQIEFTGLRPGEKLFEELLNDKENTTPTYHPKILIAKTRKYNFDKVSVLINELIYKIEDADSVFIVKLMKDMVPEFKSQNSKFAKFDKKEV
jgi:FlaA1/EpsC-like NDP-sugar epimerase